MSNVVSFTMDARVAGAVQGLLQIAQAQEKGERAFAKTASSVRGFEDQVGRAYRTGRNFMSLFAGSAAVAGLVAFSKKSLDLADNLAAQADKLGLSVEALQEYRYAANQSNIATETLDKAVQILGLRLSEAAKGKGAAAKELAELGISAFDASGRLRGLDEVLPEIARKLQNVESQIDKNRIAYHLFGREGVSMTNLLKDGGAELEKLRREARDTGQVLSNDMARSADELNDKLASLSGTITNSFRKALLDNLDPLTKVVDKMAEWVDLGSKGLKNATQFFNIEEIKRYQRILDDLSKRQAGGQATGHLGNKRVPIAEAIAHYQKQQAAERAALFSGSSPSQPFGALYGGGGSSGSGSGSGGKATPQEEAGLALGRLTEEADKGSVAIREFRSLAQQSKDFWTPVADVSKNATGNLLAAFQNLYGEISKDNAQIEKSRTLTEQLNERLAKRVDLEERASQSMQQSIDSLRAKEDAIMGRGVPDVAAMAGPGGRRYSGNFILPGESPESYGKRMEQEQGAGLMSGWARIEAEKALRKDQAARDTGSSPPLPGSGHPGIYGAAGYQGAQPSSYGAAMQGRNLLVLSQEEQEAFDRRMRRLQAPMGPAYMYTQQGVGPVGGGLSRTNMTPGVPPQGSGGAGGAQVAAQVVVNINGGNFMGMNEVVRAAQRAAAASPSAIS